MGGENSITTSGDYWITTDSRFKAQVLCNERALLAAMAYVDLNPVRAGIATRLDRSDHTSIQARLLLAKAKDLAKPLQPVGGALATCLQQKGSENIFVLNGNVL